MGKKNTLSIGPTIIFELLTHEFERYIEATGEKLNFWSIKSFTFTVAEQFGKASSDLAKAKCKQAIATNKSLSEAALSFIEDESRQETADLASDVSDWAQLEKIKEIVKKAATVTSNASSVEGFENGDFGKITTAFSLLADNLDKKFCELSLFFILYNEKDTYLSAEQKKRFELATEFVFDKHKIFNAVDQSKSLKGRVQQLQDNYFDGLSIIKHNEPSECFAIENLTVFLTELLSKSNKTESRALLNAYTNLRKRNSIKHLDDENEQTEYSKLIANSLLNIPFIAEPENILAYFVAKYVVCDLYRELRDEDFLKAFIKKIPKLATESGTKSHNERQLSFNKLWELLKGFSYVRTSKASTDATIVTQVECLAYKNRKLCKAYGEKIKSYSGDLGIGVFVEVLKAFVKFTPGGGLMELFLYNFSQYLEKYQKAVSQRAGSKAEPIHLDVGELDGAKILCSILERQFLKDETCDEALAASSSSSSANSSSASMATP